MSQLKVNAIRHTGASSDAITLASDGTATYAATNGTSNFTISDGNLVIGTAGHGIDFSATANGPSQSQELLDDYEEGTWTIAASNGGATLTIESGCRYTKIGNKVFCEVDITVGSNSSGLGAYMTQPFTGKNYSGGAVNYTAYNSTLVVHTGNTQIEIRKGSDSNAGFSWSELSGLRVIFAFSYSTDS